VWALSHLLGREEFATLAVKVMGAETNDGVREEWQLTRTAARPSS
jgi:hypothetical protein